jgi:formylglycine-generating enzyme required for sulfatase activity
MGYNPSNYEGDNLPVECVSWDEVQEFIQILNEKSGKQYRLPTEAEWEFAARGGISSRGYKYSDSNNADNVAWLSSHPIGTKQSNELGIYDMSGNVGEWCSDLWGNYYSVAQTNPKGPLSGSERVYRAPPRLFGVEKSRGLRVSSRYSWRPDGGGFFIGFRLASSSK